MGDPRGELSGDILPSKWLPDNLNKFFAAVIGDDFGEKCFLETAGERVLGETDRLVTTGERVGEDPDRTLKEAEFGSDLDLALLCITSSSSSSSSGCSNPVADKGESGERSPSPLPLSASVKEQVIN